MTDEPRKLWGVTTLLSNGLPKPALVGWAARTVAEYAVAQRRAWLPLAESDPAEAVALLTRSRFKTSGKAADRGTEIHDAAEKLAQGQRPGPLSPAASRHVGQFEQFLADHAPRYILAEAPVYNLALGYAGTLDAVVEIGGRVGILDIKTTDKGPTSKGKRPPYPEVALQMAAYSRAELVGQEPPERDKSRGGDRFYLFDPSQAYEPMPRVECAWVLAISPEDYRLIPVSIGQHVWESFLAAREVALWTLETSKGVLGRPLVSSIERKVA